MKKKAKLDRSRSFAEVIGVVQDGVRYQQDGKDFDGQGNEVGARKADEAIIVVTPAPADDTPSVPEAAGATPPQPVKRKGRPKGSKNKKTGKTRKRRAPATANPEIFQ